MGLFRKNQENHKGDSRCLCEFQNSPFICFLFISSFGSWTNDNWKNFVLNPGRILHKKPWNHYVFPEIVVVDQKSHIRKLKILGIQPTNRTIS